MLSRYQSPGESWRRCLSAERHIWRPDVAVASLVKRPKPSPQKIGSAPHITHMQRRGAFAAMEYLDAGGLANDQAYAGTSLSVFRSHRG